MKIFFDGADCDAIRHYRDLGLIHGVTTNPEILSADPRSKNPFDLARKIIAIMGDDPVFLQVVGRDPETQLEEAKRLAALGKGVVVKVGMDKVGLKSIPLMVNAGIQVSATAVNTIGRAILAGECGANYMIPYYGYLKDVVEETSNFIEEVAAIYQAQGYRTKLHIYCRRVDDIQRAAKAGAWGVLLQAADLERFFHHAQTEIAVNGHRQAWEKRFGNTTWLDFPGAPGATRRAGR
jgi:transaldolase